MKHLLFLNATSFRIFSSNKHVSKFWTLITKIRTFRASRGGGGGGAGGLRTHPVHFFAYGPVLVFYLSVSVLLRSLSVMFMSDRSLQNQTFRSSLQLFWNGVQYESRGFTLHESFYAWWVAGEGMCVIRGFRQLEMIVNIKDRFFLESFAFVCLCSDIQLKRLKFRVRMQSGFVCQWSTVVMMTAISTVLFCLTITYHLGPSVPKCGP